MTRDQMKRSGYLRIFASYYRPHWKLFALDMVCALCICLVDLAFPVISRYSMQELLPGRRFSAFFAVMAALLAARGFEVTGFTRDPEKAEAVNRFGITVSGALEFMVSSVN